MESLKIRTFGFFIIFNNFILKHIQDSEFVILWTSGIKKIDVVNLFLFSSILVLVVYISLSAFITPFALNKSRQLLSNDKLNSFLPTIKRQQFSDSFKGFTFIVEKKINNELQNIFLHDKGNNLRNLSSNASDTFETTIISENGIIDEKKMILFNGQIISSKKNSENEVVKFEQLNIDLSNLVTTTIKVPKIQEISTIRLFSCFIKKFSEDKICSVEFKKEILPTLNRRLVIPFYIPVISLICSLLLIKSERKYFHKISIFLYSFTLLIFTELAVRYSGINRSVMIAFILIPFTLLILIYFFLIYKFKREAKAR